jgi:hypothetical protein
MVDAVTQMVDGFRLGAPGRGLCRRQVWRPPELVILVAPPLPLPSNLLRGIRLGGRKPLELQLDGKGKDKIY